MTLQERIALAEHHVESGRRIVARQREIVAEGNMGAVALELLAVFEKSQAIFEGDLANLLGSKADPFVKRRLLDLADKYDSRAAWPSRASRMLTAPVSQPKT